MNIMYCQCGEPIRIEWEWNGLDYVPFFSNRAGDKISHCPGCGEALDRQWIEQARRNYDQTTT